MAIQRGYNRSLAAFPPPLDSTSADELCDSLLAFNAWQRRLLLRNRDRPALVQLVRVLLRRCQGLFLSDAAQAKQVAALAVETAEAIRLSRGHKRLHRRVLADLRAEAWAYLANAHRVSGELIDADGLWAKVREHAEAGTGEVRLTAELSELEALLRLDQRRPAQAIPLLEQTLGAYRRLGDSSRTARLQIMLASAYYHDERLSAAIAQLSEALRALDPGRDGSLLLGAMHNLVGYLAEAGRERQALALMRAQEWLYDAFAPPLLALRARWLKGRLYLAAQHWRAAVEHLEAVRRDLVERQMTLDAALASLDLALVYAANDRPAMLVRLATEVMPVLTVQGLPQEAAAAFGLFVKAAQEQQVSQDLVRRLLHDLEPVRGRRPAGRTGSPA